MIGEWTNHLWQSTWFAAAAALLTVAFRKNRAQVRYWLWLSASFKFLIPFSLLTTLGDYLWYALPARKVAAEIASSTISLTMIQIAQPFPDAPPFAPSTSHMTNWIPIAILGVWACGFAAITLMRFRGWLRIRAAVRASTVIDIPAAVEVRSSPGLLEPGVVGLLSPVLLLPEGILNSLTPPQLEAVLAHELSHIRRRDNLTSATHMIVEAAFWFHPLVWWIGARLVEERERACDEAVMNVGSEPRAYVEAILKVCKLYVESPLVCVSGISGSDLKKRIVRIMTQGVARRLDLSGKLLLSAAGLMAVAVPVVFGLAKVPRGLAQSGQAAQPSKMPDWQVAAGGKMQFDVASVKQNNAVPSRQNVNSNIPMGPQDLYSPTGGLLSANNFPLVQYMIFAYKLTASQVQSLPSQLPKWANSNRYDIQARTSGNPTKDQFRLMMQALLADRFKLAIHYETRQVPVFALVLDRPGKLGPHLQVHPEDLPCSTAPPPPGAAPSTVAGGFPESCGSVSSWLDPKAPGRLRVGARNIQMEMFATGFSSSPGFGADRVIVDKTGLPGKYDFIMEYTPQFTGPPPPDFQPDANGPTFLEALKEYLGLKLESQTGPVDVIVVDHVEQPSEN